jgi:hypothetical protein
MAAASHFDFISNAVESHFDFISNAVESQVETWCGSHP